MYKKDTINKGVEGSTDFLACQLILSSTDVNTVMPERKKKGERKKERKREYKSADPSSHREMGKKEENYSSILQTHPSPPKLMHGAFRLHFPHSMRSWGEWHADV